MFQANCCSGLFLKALNQTVNALELRCVVKLRPSLPGYSELAEIELIPFSTKDSVPLGVHLLTAPRQASVKEVGLVCLPSFHYMDSGYDSDRLL